MHVFQESNHRVVDALKSNMFDGLRIVRSAGAYNLLIRTSQSTIVTALAISVREKNTLMLSCFSELGSRSPSGNLDLELAECDNGDGIEIFRIRSTT